MNETATVPEAPPEPAAPAPELQAPEGAPPEPPPPAGADPTFDEKVASIKIDKDLAALVPDLSEEEEARLEANLKAEGCRDPLVIWKEKGVPVDGHHRYKLCVKHRIDFKVVMVSFRDRWAAEAWIINNQLGRRNLPPRWASYLRGKRYNAKKGTHGGPRRGASSQGENSKTADVIAKCFSVSPATIARDGAFAEAVDEMAKNCGEEARTVILSGEVKLSREDIVELAKLPAEEQRAAIEKLKHPAEEPKAEEPEAPAPAPENEGAGAAEGAPADAPMANAPAGPAPAPPGKPEGKSGKAPGKGGKAGAKGGTLTLPRDPTQLAAALGKELGAKLAEKVYEALGKKLGKKAAAGGAAGPRSKERPRGTRGAQGPSPIAQ